MTFAECIYRPLTVVDVFYTVYIVYGWYSSLPPPHPPPSSSGHPPPPVLGCSWAVNAFYGSCCAIYAAPFNTFILRWKRLARAKRKGGGRERETVPPCSYQSRSSGPRRRYRFYRLICAPFIISAMCLATKALHNMLAGGWAVEAETGGPLSSLQPPLRAFLSYLILLYGSVSISVIDERTENRNERLPKPDSSRLVERWR